MSLQRAAKEFTRDLLVRSGLTRLIILARKVRGQRADHLLYPSASERFDAIYRKGIWLEQRTSGSLSGLGSELEHTEAIRQQLPGLLQSLGSRVLLDVGCGDLTWMKAVALPCEYIGVDIVPSLIESNRKLYGSETRRFAVLDATKEPLPQADTILCREVMFHLSFEDIWLLLANMRKSGAKHIIATNDTGTTFNADIISGDYRMLNLYKRPYFFPPPESFIADSAVGSHRVLSVWRIEALPLAPGR